MIDLIFNLSRCIPRRSLQATILFVSVSTQLPATENERPNVIIILADDMGFSDAGCYGSEIETPNLDQLAHDGLKFTNFYNTARCWPTRASLLTGFYAQQVHRDSFDGRGGGNKGVRPAWAPLLPVRLKDAGYRSYHSGKWHLDSDPMSTGFDQSYQLLDDNRHFRPARHNLNGKALPAETPESTYYATTAMTDYLLRFLSEHERDHAEQPFFGYLAFIAPHFPLQARQETIDKYAKHYSVGWDQVRAARLAKQHELGMNATSVLPDYEPEIGPPYDFPDAISQLGPGEVNRELPWEQLTPTQKNSQASKMAIHAAMVDSIDEEVGRVVDWLKQNKQFDNTLLLFLSDNGASAEIMIRGDGHDPKAAPGSSASYLCLGPGWSRAANTPFRRHKTWVHEGGISTPLIAHWPKGFSADGKRDKPAHVASIVPTILDLAGLPTKPDASDSGPSAFSGQSLASVMTGNVQPEAEASIWWLHENNKALRKGNFKVVKAADEEWQLYDLSADRIEAQDLLLEQPERLKQMVSEWEKLRVQYQKDAQIPRP